jgi:hypothetical protein
MTSIVQLIDLTSIFGKANGFSQNPLVIVLLAKERHNKISAVVVLISSDKPMKDD